VISFAPIVSPKKKKASTATKPGLILLSGSIKDIASCLNAFDANNIPIVPKRDATYTKSTTFQLISILMNGVKKIRQNNAIDNVLADSKFNACVFNKAFFLIIENTVPIKAAPIAKTYHGNATLSTSF
jgi:hypothetical protein